jgi:hypothetical protein
VGGYNASLGLPYVIERSSRRAGAHARCSWLYSISSVAACRLVLHMHTSEEGAGPSPWPSNDHPRPYPCAPTPPRVTTEPAPGPLLTILEGSDGAFSSASAGHSLHHDSDVGASNCATLGHTTASGDTGAPSSQVASAGHGRWWARGPPDVRSLESGAANAGHAATLASNDASWARRGSSPFSFDSGAASMGHDGRPRVLSVANSGRAVTIASNVASSGHGHTRVA